MTHSQRLLLMSVSRSGGWDTNNPPWHIDHDPKKTINKLNRLVDMGYLILSDGVYTPSRKGLKTLGNKPSK